MNKTKVVDVIVRKTSEKTVLMGEGNLSVSVSAPSVIEIHGSAQDVARYIRQGKDLLIYMKDGSVIRCNNYFVEDPDTQKQSELVFNDQQELTHIAFADTAEGAGLAATELTAQATPISSIEPFMAQDNILSDAPWGWIAGAALGGGAIGALLAHGDDGGTRTKVIDNTKEVESATPTFMVTDKAGDKQGLLSAKEITDDNTPTFTGSGQPGATIQVKDSSGSTIASTMVGANGNWTVQLPTQTDGEHTWSVVQIDGSKTTSAGSITLNVATAETSVTLATTAGDNVINASEQSAGFTLSGTSKNLAENTALTVTLNGKTYTTSVKANGTWSLEVPATDAQALGEGNWTVAVSGKDAAGNTVTGSQSLIVDTQAPALTVNTLAQDNIINAAEHGQALILSGTTTAEAGQIVTVTLNDKNYTATVGSDGTWSLTLEASDVQALVDGDHTLTANVSDKAGNPTSTTANFGVDTAAPVVTIDIVSGDDVLNTTEQGQAQMISGQASGAAAGDVVKLTLGDQTFVGVVLADGSWHIGVPASVIGALGEGSHEISVSVTDAAGNTGSAIRDITLNGAPPDFTLDTLSQDNVLNALEAVQPLTLSGTSTLPDGSAVSVTLNGVDYQTTVESGVWSVVVPVSDVLNLANTLYTVTVSGTDSVGNTGSATANLLVDTVLPQVIINTFAGDNLVNNAEAAQDQTLSGRVTGAAAGDTVSISVGGQSYTATVDADLNWSVTIPAADLTAFGDGDLTFSASVTNAHGNTGTGERDININAELPGLRINTISGDDVINAIEQQQDLTVTGSSTHLAEGTQVIVTLNGVDYPAVIAQNGSWQIGVPAADLQNWSAGDVLVTAHAVDAWGNTVTVNHPIELDLNAVAITVDTISSDDMLNAAEKAADLTLSGQTQGVEPGQSVVVKFADQTFTAQVQEDGSWSLTVPASAMDGLTDGRAQIGVSVTNVHGNSADAARVVMVDTLAPTVAIDSLTDDNIINAAEAGQDLLLSGTSNAEAGQTVTVTLNGQQYQTTVQNNGTWQLNVPAADMSALADGSLTVTASVSDVAGNSSSVDRVSLVDATVPQVTINHFVTDTNTVNQAAHSQAQILSGSVTGAAAGDAVKITIINIEYKTVVDAEGNWSLGLPASVVQGLADGTWTIDVSVTDAAGNTGSSSLDVVVNTVTPVIAINTLAVDDVINATEKGEDLLLSGTSNQPEGTTVTVSLNGINYTATTTADGSWSVTVPASAVSALGEANYSVAASVTDSVGNNASATHDVLVDSSLPVVSINTLAGDNVVNAAEVATGQTLTGSVTNAAAGDTVTITLGGQTYTATVQDDLTWSLPLDSNLLTALGDGGLTATVSVTNGHGNTSASSLDFAIDANLPGLRIDTVAGDDVINIIEHGQNLVISGSSTDLVAGSTVTLTINGNDYAATVLADGTWLAAVPAADVAQWADGELAISASAQDTSGNPVTIGTLVDVDLALVAISINSVTDDNVLNAAEKGQDLVLSGSTSGVEAGQTVSVIFGGKVYTATVDADGNWTTTIPSADLAGQKDGDATVQASVTNVNGNSVSAALDYSVDITAPTVTINTVSTDNMLNAAEAAAGLTLSGTSSAEAGQTVTVTFNGNQYSATVQADGSWTLDVPAADMAGIADGNAAITASVSDKAGNPASTGASVLVDVTVPQITFNTVSGDDVINSTEHGQALMVSGSVTGAQAGDVITVTLNGTDYTAMLDANGNWRVGVPAGDVGALVNGDVTISATVSDKAGNSTSATHDVSVTLDAPVIAIDTLAVDDVINATEKGEDLLLSGTSNQPEGTTVTVSLNGINYTATTAQDGSWSVTVPASAVSALGEANYSVAASVTDSVGNSASATHDVLVDSSLPVVSINTLAGDNVVNAAEVAAGQTLTGSVTNAAAGDTVTITLGGQTYTATVQDDLTWSLPLDSNLLTALGDGSLTATVSVTNGHGNTSASSLDFSIDANLPGLRIDTVAGDDVINIIEHGQNLVIFGSSTDLVAGSTVTLTINGNDYAATVLADGTWLAAVPAADVAQWADGELAISASAQDTSGNPVTIGILVDVDLSPVAISINSVTDDNVLNAAEKGQDLVLSGSTSGVEAGQTVSVLFGGKVYTATVDADGNWTTTVPSADLAGQKDGDATVQASVTNVNGNSVSAALDYSVDITAPTVTINTVSNDNMLNAAEAAADLTLSGTSSAEAGQTVTVSFNGNEYQATVQADGSWTLDVPAADMAGIADGNAAITASVSDKAGNLASTGASVLVDVTVPQITFNTVSGDDVINSTERGEALMVSGSVTGAQAGDVVTMTLNGTDYTAMLDANGNWSVGVPAEDVWALDTGNSTISATVTDKAGNSTSATHDVAVIVDVPQIAFNSIAMDNVINATEKGEDLLLTGYSNQPEGTTVTVRLNDGYFYATTAADGSWSVTVPANQVGWLGEANYRLTASVTDSVGNTGSAVSDVLVNTVLPLVTLNTIAGDDVVNSAEVAAGQTISGKVSNAEAGNTVTLTIGGNTYTATVQDDLTWSVNVPADVLTAIGNGDLTVTASVTNNVGNTGSVERDITIDANLPGLRVDTVAGDDVINSIEHAQNLIITGASDGLTAGTLLTVTLNGKTYPATVLADGTWSAAVPATDVSALAAGSVTVTVEGQSSAGNPVAISHDVTVDLAEVAISIDVVSTDDVINAAEKGVDLVLSGSTSNVEAGQTVSVTFGGKSYTASVDAEGNWTTTVPAADLTSLKDGDASVQANVTNVNGNSASAGREYSVDATAPGVTISTIAADDMLNATEAQTDLTLTGTSTAEAGQTVTLTLNGVEYTTTVGADGNWSVTVPAADLAALNDGVLTVTAAVSDKAGNPASVDHTLTVDLTAPVVTINTVAGDDVINLAEHAQAQIISGSATGAAAGDKVTVTVGGQTYTTVLDAAGNWSVGVPASVISALQDGSVTISASVTDVAGNTGTGTHDVTVDTGLPSVGFDAISSDNVLNAVEKGQDLSVSGTSANLSEGTLVTVSLNGKNYTATTAADGSWSLTVPAADLAALGEANYTLSAAATSDVGNSISNTANLRVDTALPGVTINTIAGDDVINAAEVAAGQTLSGKVVNAEAGNTVTLTIGGNTYTATVQDDLTWSVNVPADVLTALGNGDLTVTASVTNGVGNTGSGERDMTIDANLPGLRVDTVAGDDVINSIEHAQNLIITGASDGLIAGTLLTVTVNGKTYPATVLADGTWSAAIPATDVSALAAGTVTVSVEGQSTAGNPVAISHDVTVDLAEVAISIDVVSTDDVINAAEKGADLVLSGSTSNVEEGQTVSVTFGGKSYTASVDADGNWTTTVPAADLTNLKDGDASVQASVTNVNGNSASAGREYSVDATAPTVTIDIISDDNILNATEAQADLTLSGTSNAEAGQTVTVNLNGVDYTTAVEDNGTWSLTVPAADLSTLGDGTYTVNASVSDKAGNPASAARDVLVDITVPQLTINTVSGDDVINTTEHGQALIVSGSATGAAAGDLVTVTVNDKSYTAVLDGSGNWSIGIPAADVGALTAGDYTVTAALTDKAGNSNSATHDVAVNLTAPVLTIGTVSGDDVINSSEKTQDLTISGTATGLAAGAIVTVMLNGKAYSATVDDNGLWTTTIPADQVGALGEALYDITASATDSVGNSSSTTHTVNVGSALPGVTINTIAGDDVVNAAEVAAGQTLSGKVVNAEAGNTVTLTIGGNTYTATVQSDLTWSVNVPADVLTALGNGDLTVVASVTNGVGNTGSGERDMTIDANIPGLRVDTVAGDDVINSIEHAQNLIITGSSDGLTAGTLLTVTVNGKTYPATVLADGTWSAAIPATDVSALAAGSVTVTVEGQSTAGNPVAISHDVTVDLAEVAISIDVVSTDDVINAAEKGADLVLSGSTSNVEAGQTVSVTFGGKSYTASVDADGNWTTTVPAADLTNLKDGDASVQASVTNVSGNSASAGREYSVDATAPSVTISTIAADDMLNATEAQADLTLTGTSTAEAGQTVTLTLNGVDYTTTVGADGNWALVVPAADLAALNDGVLTVTAAVSDKAGNPASVDHTLTVDLTAPVVTINTVAGDDVINLAEHAQAQIISGSATGAVAGDKVTVTVGGQTYTTVLDAAGNWSVGVPASVISALQDGSVTISASVTDVAGNTGTGTHDVSVDTGLPSVGFDAISADNVLNAVEKGQDLNVSGTSANLSEGTLVTVSLNGKNYTATTAADGSWSLTVPAADLAALGEANYTLSAAATSDVGNSISNTANLRVDTALPGVTLNTIAGDDVINAAEVAAGQNISGKVVNAEAGNTVTLTIGGNTYTATVQSDLTWSVNVPADVLTALGNGDLTVVASVTNGVGNTGSGERDMTINANIPGLRVDTVAGDDVINSIEHGQNLIITGSSDGLAQGTLLTVTVNGKTYPATVLADGTWSAAVPATDVSALAAGSVTVTVEGQSGAGNPVAISHDVTVDLAEVAISIDVISTDDVINAAEKGVDLVLSGSTSNVEAGQTVSVTFGGKSYTASVDAEGNWTTTVPSADLTNLKDGDASVQASVTNVNGNSASAGREYSVDATAPTVTISTIAADDMLNATEAQADLTLTGTSTAEAGQTVTLSLNGVDYTTTVGADGNWSVTVPAADLAALNDGVLTVTASVSDKAGNPASVDHTLTVDLTAPVVTINTVAGDDVINLAEHAQAQIISGSATGAAAGDKVTVTVGGQTYTTVLDAAGNWSVGVPASVISALQDGSVTISASVTDVAGNTGTGTHDVTVDTGLPSVGFDAISADNVLNAVEKGQDLNVSGTSANLSEGTQVTVSLNGKNYTATTAADGSWSLTVPAADLAALGEANYTLSAAATSDVGNSISNTANLRVDTALPGVTINTIAGDDVVNAAEVAAGQTISGKVSNAEAGNTVTLTIGGNTYTATVQDDLTWSVNVPADVLTAIGNGDLTVTASVTNGVGNTGSVERDITIDANLPGLRVDTVAGDDVINSIEHGQNLIITGSSDGLTAGTLLTVTVNGKTYPATVLADGTWSAAVPAADVNAFAAGSVTVSVEGQSTAGNPVAISHDVTVDLAEVAISIDVVSTDDVINAAEKGADLVLSGSTSNVEEGQTVSVTFGGKSYTASVDADGNWTTTVPAADLTSLKDGDASVQASVTNVNGNSASAGREYSVDATAPTVIIDTVASDNVINGSEAAAGVAITGSTTAEVGQTVTVTLGGNSYTAQVQQGGIWSVTVPTADLTAMADSGYTVQASVNDAAGNPGSADKVITLDTTPPVISFNTVAGDDVINREEHAQAQIVSGTTTGASVGDKLVITIGANQYTTTVDASGNWSVGVPASVISALQDGTTTISATITDGAGNSSTQTHDVAINTASVMLTVNTISDDDVINAAEAGNALTIGGSSAQFASGTQVTVTLNGKNYVATIQDDGSWTTTVPATDVAALADGGNYGVFVSAEDSVGNSATASHAISVDLTAPVVSIATLSGDDVLNAAEAQQPLTVNGSSSAEAGQTVTVTLGGKTYTATVASDGTWTLDVPATDLSTLSQGALTVTASVNDKAGNNGQTTHTLTVDTLAPTVTIAAVAGDDIVNNTEQLAGQTISGTTTAEQGQIVTVSFNGHSYQATAAADGTWSVFVPGRDFLGLSDGSYTITASVSDKAGNPGSGTHDVTLSGDVPTITINTFAEDDIVSAAEHGTPLMINGTTDAPAGQTVTITLNGKTYTTTVQNDGTWSTTLGSADVTALADGGAYVINAQVSNAIGNSVSADHTINVDLTAPSMGISIDSLQNDTGLSGSDFITSDSSVVVNGSLTAQLGNNEKAQISLDGGTTWTDLTVTGTTWRYSDSRTLTDGTYQYQVRVIDNAGNVGATDSQDVVIDLTAPAATIITVDAVTQDTGLSASDFITSDNQISLKGTLGATLASGEHAQISIDGGVTWSDVSVSGTSWTYVDGRTLADGDYNYQLRVIDDAGNISASVSQVVTIDTTVPDASKVITIDSISDDTGLSNSDFITNDTSLTVNGTLAATLSEGEYAQISIDGGVTWQNVNVTGNSWFYTDTRTLDNGTYTYFVRVVDAAGNIGSNAQQQVTVDTVAPDAAITVTVDNIAVDTGFDNNDFLTSSTSYTLNGTLGAALGSNEFVQVSMDGGTTWVYAEVNGTQWSYNDARTLTDGSYNYQVRVVDQAGNVGATTSQAVTVDTQSPQYGITIDSISDDTGQSTSDFITMDTTLTVNGSLGSALASDERVQISLDGGNTWIDASVTNQRWSYVDTRELADGDYTYQVRIIDQAGNVGSTTSQEVTVDTTVPATVGTVVSYTDSEGERQGTFGSSVTTDDTSPVITGTLNRAPDEGEIMQLYRDGILLGQVTMNGSASWSFQDNGLSDGNHTYVLRITDLAGNYTESAGFVLGVDTSVPTTVATVTAQTTSDTTPIVGGNVSADLENGEYLEVKVNGKTYTSQTGGAVVVDPDHNTWYLQIPDSDTLAVASYDVTAQVKSSAGNGNNTGVTTGSLVIGTTTVNTDWATTAGNSNNEAMSVGLNSSGLWTIIANGQAYSSSDASTYAANALTNTRGGNVISYTSADYDRNGTMDVFATETSYTNNTQVMWTYDGSSYTGSQQAMGAAIYYGGVIAYDKTGDGYLDMAYGDAGMDSLTYLVNNNGVLTPDGTGGEGGFYGQFDSGREISGVDINNDGAVDVVQHTNRSSAYTLTVISNSGTGTLSVGQDITNVFVGNSANTTTAASMTWADFNGDGYMDLYLGTTYNNNGGVIYYNDGAGKLLTTKSAVEASNATAGYLSVAVDWNADGQMDIVKLSTYGGSQTATLFTNNGYGSTWTSSQLASALVNVTGMAAVDYNWDGAQDLLVSQQNGKVVLLQNSKTITDGTAMHLHIVDSEGINAYYGNTVNLYNAAGVLVASQIINAQSGVGSNDTTALVSFYGLDPSETYSAQIVKITNGVSDNVTWDGLEAGNGKEGYVLTAEAATGVHSGTITGTGYNDTFVAEDGTYTYNGSGGWNTTSDYDTWSNTGGMDVVDYRNATSAVTVDLRLSTAQDTGFGTSRLLNIEGINGSDYNDVITGNSSDNQFEGRGGNDTFNIGSGGHDTLLYKLINASDATGGNGSDVVNGFTVGTWEGTADTDRIDLRDLLSGSGYTGTGSASYVNGVAALDSSAGNVADYIRVVQNGSNTEIQVDLDGSSGQFTPTTLVTLNGVQTDLATLLANHQLLIA
ncbi:Ig-like domain-containing protein [Lelliottia sp. V106_12]|uniref:Ig-like domain-containing protein n=1 Tax=Lelliottia wanjuensis TaxID=3050585 RepID=A0AAP4CZI4_9ENTR|nr:MULTISPECIES: Ig-like domain-containing protein [unclassified Lelliottia]MDK9362202.1 Ig-like domain-containing protein [Lelliottia sp. V106_12]MDK9618144.1 Ig-like domain-containing protein [Lelliottia sp. V106_9]